MSRMLRLNALADLPPQARSRVREMFARTPAPAAHTEPAPKPKPKPKPKNYAHALMLQIMAAPGMTLPIREYHFAQQGAEGRGWAFDMAWPELKLAIEVDGMVHRIKARYRADMEKQQDAFFDGWRCLRVSPRQVDDGSALDMARRAVQLAQEAT